MSLRDRYLPHRLRARLLAANLMLAFVLLVALGVLALVVTGERSAGKRAEHSGRVIEATATLQKDVLELETGARGYLISRSRLFLDPWTDARVAVPADTERLVALVGDNPAQLRRAKVLAQGVRDYSDDFSEPLVATTIRRPREAVARVKTGEGRRRVDRLRLEFARFVAAEQRLLAQRGANANRQRTVALAVIGGGVLLLALFVVLEQIALHRWVLRPLERLGTTTERIGAGDFATRTDIVGPDAIGDLGRAINGMADSLQERDDELVRSNRQLEEFAYIASHALAEPLRAMGGYADLLTRRHADELDPRARRYLDGITAGAERMRGLIDDLLAYSRVGRRELDKRPVDMQALVASVCDDLSMAIEESGAQVVAHHLPTVTGDLNQLRMVVQNLVANAIKFRGEAPPRIDIRAETDAKCWTFRVEDNGIGIEPRHAERIFRMFQRLHTREEYEGTGIGLALVERVLQRHDGRIWVESRPEGGSRFSFTLPRDGG